MLPWPIEFFSDGATGNDQDIVANITVAFSDQYLICSVDFYNKIFNEIDAVLCPKKIFVRFGMLIFHVTHIDVHEGCSRKEMIRLTRNDRYHITSFLADMSGTGNA